MRHTLSGFTDRYQVWVNSCFARGQSWYSEGSSRLEEQVARRCPSSAKACVKSCIGDNPVYQHRLGGVNWLKSSFAERAWGPSGPQAGDGSVVCPQWPTSYWLVSATVQAESQGKWFGPLYLALVKWGLEYFGQFWSSAAQERHRQSGASAAAGHQAHQRPKDKAYEERLGNLSFFSAEKRWL